MNEGNDICVRGGDAVLRIRREERDIAEKTADTLYFFCLRGGTCGAQLFISPRHDVRFRLERAALKDSRGHTLSEECFAAFYEKYIHVDRNWNKNGYPTGDYPDALIPEKAPVLHGEDNVLGGENGAVYVELSVPEAQPFGTYRGSFTVCADGQRIRIPVIAEVSAANLPQIFPRSLFHTNPEQVAHYEADATQAMYDRYSDCMREHRLCPTQVVLRDAEKEDGRAGRIEKWLAGCVRSIEAGANTISVPSVCVQGAYGDTFSEDELVAYLTALGEESIRSDRDLYRCAAFYDWMIDEPFFCRYPDGKVQDHIQKFASACARTQQALQSKYPSIPKRLLDSLRGIPHIVTDYLVRPSPAMLPLKDKTGSLYHYDVREVTLCPKFDAYAERALCEGYDAGGEKWWYGCNTPNAPFPGYHIDDAGESAELVGWLMARYHIVGNLYWVTNHGMECNTTGKPQYLDDPFGTAHRGFGANGEGVLVYPGKTYGIEGPVPTLRLKCIRDGNEDYAVLTALQKAYRARGADAESVLDALFAPLADGSKFDAFGAHFAQAKRTLYALYELSELYGMTVSVSEREEELFFRFQSEKPLLILADGKPIGEGWGACRQSAYVRFTAQDGAFRREFAFWCGRALKIILHETLFERNAYSGDAVFTIERDEIRRAVFANTQAARPNICIDTGEALRGYTAFGLVVRSKEADPLPYTLSCGGIPVMGGVLRVGWNRLTANVPTMSEGGVLELHLSRRADIQLGEVYCIG